MKYKDYYQILGIARSADLAAIKTAYRKLARKYHPDVSKEKDAEARFKEVGEAYDTLKDTEKRAAYDQLGRFEPGENFRPAADWQQQHTQQDYSFEDIDLSDLFSQFGAGFGRQPGAGKRRGPGRTARSGHHSAPGDGFGIPGEDFEANVQLSLEEAISGSEVAFQLNLPEYDGHGAVKRVPHTVKVRIPKGASNGQRLRVPGKGAKGINGGRDGDLYLTISLQTHPLYRVSGHDIFIDLPLTPWEAVLGTQLPLPTPSGAVQLTVPPGAQSGQKLRLAKRGMPTPQGQNGDLYAIVQIVIPASLNKQERELFEQLKQSSTFDARSHFVEELKHAR